VDGDISLSVSQRLPSVIGRVIPPGSVNDYQRKLVSKRAYHAMH